jgi:hypothetical protein
LHDNNVGDAGAAALFGSGAAPRKLRPSSNGITTVPATVRGLARLEELYPYHNKLVSVDGAIVALEGMLRRIDLDGNGDTLLQPPAVYARNYDGGDSSDSEDGGDSSPAPLSRYSREAGVPYSRAKLVLVGDERAGKAATRRMLGEGKACATAAAEPDTGAKFTGFHLS